jgi:hypothetical protein
LHSAEESQHITGRTCQRILYAEYFYTHRLVFTNAVIASFSFAIAGINDGRSDRQKQREVCLSFTVLFPYATLEYMIRQTSYHAAQMMPVWMLLLCLWWYYFQHPFKHQCDYPLLHALFQCFCGTFCHRVNGPMALSFIALFYFPALLHIIGGIMKAIVSICSNGG